jgi:hypothetical protein
MNVLNTPASAVLKVKLPTGIGFLLCAVLANAATLPIQVITHPWQAAAGNSNMAYVLIQLSNADGTPKIDGELPKPNPGDPTSGVELKGSKWGFETLLVPPGYQGSGVEIVRPQTFFDPAVSRSVLLPGQLRIVQITPAFQKNPSDTHAGLYFFSILPMYGFKGGKKLPLRWISGEYTFRVSYRDGNDQGIGLGVLVIR